MKHVWDLLMWVGDMDVRFIKKFDLRSIRVRLAKLTRKVENLRNSGDKNRDRPAWRAGLPGL